LVECSRGDPEGMTELTRRLVGDEERQGEEGYEVKKGESENLRHMPDFLIYRPYFSLCVKTPQIWTDNGIDGSLYLRNCWENIVEEF